MQKRFRLIKSRNLVDTTEEVLNRLQSMISDKNILIDWNAPREIVVIHDKLWMQEALLNLLKNAIEHSKPGGKIMIQAKNSPIYTELVIQDFEREFQLKNYLIFLNDSINQIVLKSTDRPELDWHLSKLL